MATNYALIPGSLTMKTEALREVKDMSKNLVSGDYEREYRGVKERSGRRQLWLNLLVLGIGALAGCLLVLTVVREVQFARLQEEVKQLSANMSLMTATIDTLKQKLDQRHYNEFIPTDDTIYTDEDEADINIPVEDSKNPNKQKQGNRSLEKLHDLTVLEDEDDDDELYGEEDGEEGAESGDWYQDYDRRREKIGTTNLVRLKPEDFTNNRVSFGQQNQPNEVRLATIRQIKRLLNENPENPNIAASLQSSSIMPPAEPTEAETVREKRSVFSEAPLAPLDQFTAPRVSTKNDERRKTKKYNPFSEQMVSRRTPTVSRTTRSESESGSTKPFIAAHFYGNTSHLSPGIHEHYKGNGLVRVAHDAAHDVWYPSPWTLASPHPRPTLTRNGHVHVRHTGVYLVYVQIYYLDTHDIISWVLHRTNADIEGRETLLQCAQSSHSSEALEKPNSCFSAAALFLKSGDRLAVRNTGGDRHSLMQPEKSFIGLIKLADAEDPNDEF